MNKHNAHVKEFYRWMVWLSENNRKPLAQIYWFTQDKLENDINWKADYVKST